MQRAVKAAKAVIHDGHPLRSASPWRPSKALIVQCTVPDRLVPRPSFFQLNQVRKARTHGVPLRIIAHEDVLVFRQPHEPASPR
jgi:hypothetical protein